MVEQGAAESRALAAAASNHNPAFDFDERAMPMGAKALAAMTLEYLARR